MAKSKKGLAALVVGGLVAAVVGGVKLLSNKEENTNEEVDYTDPEVMAEDTDETDDETE